MTRRALRALLSCSLLLAACTSAEAPPPQPRGETPEPIPTPPPTPIPTQTPPLQPVDVPQESSLEWVRANACEEGAPMSLTASDGTGLRLASLTARAVVEGPLAFTELRLSFDNPEDRQLEGRFAITLPPGAAISRFAMEIDGRWQEGEVVERQAARRAYEDFLHRAQDPALLENDAGNVFRARVFPIPPRARKELVLSYSQELSHSAEPYRLPLCGLPTLDELDVDVAIVQGAVAVDSSLAGQATSVYHLGLKRKNLAPTQDLEARLGHPAANGVRHGDLAIVRVAPVLETSAQTVEELTILMDTSASRALDFGGQVKRIGAVVAALPPAARVKLMAYDQGTELVYRGRADGLGSDELESLLKREALGASNLSQALDTLLAGASVDERLLLVGDGVVTAGQAESASLQVKLRELAAKGLVRVDAIVDGGIQDESMLTSLTRAGLPHDGIVLDARLSATSLAERLGRATRSGVKVEVPGAEWVWPTTLDGIQPGDERLIYAQLPEQQTLRVQLTGASLQDPAPALAHVPEPLLARAHAKARIAALQTQRAELPADDSKGRAKLAEQIVELSTRHRVLSDLTALLVLETEADYERFGIDRRALAEIMTVGTAGIEMLQRRDAVVTKTVEVEKLDKAKDEKESGKKKKKGRMGLDDFDVEADEDGGDFDPELDPEPESEEEPMAAADDGDSERAAQRAPVRPGRPAPSEPAARSASRGLGASGSGFGGGGASAFDRSKPPVADPYEGRLATVMKAIARGNLAAAEREALDWRRGSPGDVLALVAVGEVREAQGDAAAAARVYGSLIDLFPSRADIRRMAGERLERLGEAGLPLAIDTYAHAVEQRPDHPASHRLYAYALLKAGRHAEAFAALEAALDRSYPGGRFAGVERVLREDLGLVGAAWIAADPSVRTKVEAALGKRSVTLPTTRSTRFVLNWETDANDVDLHVYDSSGGHAYYSNRSLSSGGTLYDDVTTGYGPECFTIPGKRGSKRYRIFAHYYRRGPMGYGMGKLQAIEHDGRGGLTFAEHPFVIMKDDGYVDLATIGATIAPLPKKTVAETKAQ